MPTILAEFYAGPRDGEVRALPALLPTVERAVVDVRHYLRDYDITAATEREVYELEYDAQGDPVKRGSRYRYTYRRPE